MRMMLSKAIRKGSVIRPKAENFLYKDGSSCVMGAALEGFGYPLAASGDHGGWTPDAYRFYDAVQRLSNRLSGELDLPAGVLPRPYRSAGILISDLWIALVALNNLTGMTREEIADWLEGEEKRLGIGPLSFKPDSIPYSQ